jgi:hypothetical protein
MLETRPSMEATTMISLTSRPSGATPDFPERLASTARDRRLESTVLAHLVRSRNETEHHRPMRTPSIPWQQPIDGPD